MERSHIDNVLVGLGIAFYALMAVILHYGYVLNEQDTLLNVLVKFYVG